MSTQQRRSAPTQAAPEYDFGDAHQRAVEHKSLNQRTAILIPEGVKIWQSPKMGSAKIDIMPYRVGEGNPHQKPGKIYYERTYFCHQRIGPNKGSTYCCTFSVFGRRCAVCDYTMKEMNRPDHNKQLLKDWNVKERQLFWIVDYADMKSGIQLWEYSYHLFGKKLDEKMKAVPKYKHFFHPTSGYSLLLNFESVNRGGFTFSEVTNIEMEQRAKPYPMTIIEKAKCLDDLLVETPYKELAKILTQVGGLPDEEDGAPADEGTEPGFDLFADGGSTAPTGDLESDFPFDTPEVAAEEPVLDDAVFPGDEGDTGFDQSPDVDADATQGDFDLEGDTTPADDDFPFEGNADAEPGTLDDAFNPEPDVEPEPEPEVSDPNCGFAVKNFVSFAINGTKSYGTIAELRNGVAKIDKHPDKSRVVKNCKDLTIAKAPPAKPAATTPARPAPNKPKPAPTPTAPATKPKTTPAVPAKRPTAPAKK